MLWYPTSIIASLLSSSFFLEALGTSLWKIEPKTLKWFTNGFLPLHTCSRTFSLVSLFGHLFNTYAAIVTTSPYNQFGMLFCFNMDLVISNMLLFLLSYKSLYLGVYEVVTSWSIPWFIQNSSNTLEVYFPPPSILRTLIFFSFWFSTSILDF